MNELPEHKQMLIYSLLEDGMSIRTIAKIVKVSKVTVGRYSKFYWASMEEEFREKHLPMKGGYWHHKKHR